MKHQVNLWGSHPHDENDDCWTGDEYATFEEAFQAYLKHEEFFEAWELEGVRYIELRSPEGCEIKEVTGYAFSDEGDEDWERERALEAGMLGGVGSYNDYMGY